MMLIALVVVDYMILIAVQDVDYVMSSATKSLQSNNIQSINTLDTQKNITIKQYNQEATTWTCQLHKPATKTTNNITSNTTTADTNQTPSIVRQKRQTSQTKPIHKIKQIHNANQHKSEINKNNYK